jgi:hypothetical protein
MSAKQLLLQKIEALPESKQKEVIDFVEYLVMKYDAEKAKQEHNEWNQFALEPAMERT